MFLSSETLTSIIRTSLPIIVELMDLVSLVIIFPFQVTLLRWLTFLLESQTVIHIVLLFWIYVFLLARLFILQLGNSDHVVISVSIDFPSNSQEDALFHCIAYDHSCADWDGLCDHLRDVSWEDIFKLSVSAAASEFCEWVQLETYIYIPHGKYVIPHLHGFQLLLLLP